VRSNCPPTCRLSRLAAIQGTRRPGPAGLRRKGQRRCFLAAPGTRDSAGSGTGSTLAEIAQKFPVKGSLCGPVPHVGRPPEPVHGPRPLLGIAESLAELRKFAGRAANGLASRRLRRVGRPPEPVRMASGRCSNWRITCGNYGNSRRGLRRGWLGAGCAASAARPSRCARLGRCSNWRITSGNCGNSRGGLRKGWPGGRLRRVGRPPEPRAHALGPLSN